MVLSAWSADRVCTLTTKYASLQIRSLRCHKVAVSLYIPQINPCIHLPPETWRYNDKTKGVILDRIWSPEYQCNQRNSRRTELFWNRPLTCTIVLTNSWNAEILMASQSDRFVAPPCKTPLPYFLATPFTWSLLAEGFMNVLTHATVLKLILFAFCRIFANVTGKYFMLKINFPRPEPTSTWFMFLLTDVWSV